MGQTISQRLFSRRGTRSYSSATGRCAGFFFMLQDTLKLVWLAGICIQIVLAVLLVVRRGWRKFPVFSLYFIFNLLLSGVLFLLSITQVLRPRVYFYFYWISEELVLALGLAVVFEVLVRLLIPYPTIKKTVMPACFLAIALLAVFDVIVICTHHSAGAIGRMVPFLRAEEAVRVLQAGMVVFLYLCAGFFRLRLRQVEFGIALGMGVYAALQLIVVVMMAHLGWS